jgi:hypothetical protein
VSLHGMGYHEWSQAADEPQSEYESSTPRRAVFTRANPYAREYWGIKPLPQGDRNLTKKSPPMNILRVSHRRGSHKSLWFAFFAAVIVIIALVFWSHTQGQGKLAMKANPNKSGPNDTELRTRLSKEQYRVTREGATETPFQNAYWDNHKAGIYVDIITGEPLFSSLDKFDSGTGWPSFTNVRIGTISASFIAGSDSVKAGYCWRATVRNPRGTTRWDGAQP